MDVKKTGITRPMDDLGRIVIPKELRKQFKLDTSDLIEIYVTDDAIVLKKFVPGCDICGGFDNVQYFKGKKFCAKCVKEIKEQL